MILLALSPFCSRLYTLTLYTDLRVFVIVVVCILVTSNVCTLVTSNTTTEFENRHVLLVVDFESELSIRLKRVEILEEKIDFKKTIGPNVEDIVDEIYARSRSEQ